MLKETHSYEEIHTSTWETYVTDNGHSGTQNSVSRTERLGHTLKQVEGSGTPGYSKRALLPENDYFISSSYDSGPRYSGSYRKVQKFAGYTLTTHRTGSSIEFGMEELPNVDLREDRAWASIDSKLLNKIKGQKINVAQAYAERGQTIGLIAGNVRKLAQAIVAVRRGNIPAAATALGVLPPRRSRKSRRSSATTHLKNEASRRWLELQYGWLPLMSDIFGAVQHCAERSLRPHIERVEATQTVRDSGTLERFLSIDKNILGRSSVDASVQCGSVVYFTVTSPLREAAQLGLTNPAQLAWELIPFSFVADWFLPVGDWLSSLDATTGCTFLKGSQSRKYKTTTLFHTHASNYNGETYTTVRRMKYSSFRRSRMVTFPSVGMPELKNPVTPTHALNAIALLTQILRK